MKLPTRFRPGTAPHRRIDQFLPPRGAQAVLDQILAQRERFCPLTGHRNFLRLPFSIELLPTFRERIEALVSEVKTAFGIDLTDAEVEFYVHAYNDGTYFGAHSDDHGGANWRRRISCVYYVHREPRRFDGGALVIYDQRERAHRVDPAHNSAVFFPSSLLHEVLPITCPSGAFEDSRFAINMWFI